MKTLPLVFVLSATAGMGAPSLRVLPHSAELRGREAVHRLIAQADLGSDPAKLLASASR